MFPRWKQPKHSTTPPPSSPLRGGEGGSVKFYSQGRWHEAPVIFAGDTGMLDGPALIVEAHQTIVVEQGWHAQIDPQKGTILRRIAEQTRAATGNTDVDPVLLEVFANLFMAIAEEMGVVLQNTATSVNIKERLDFSCAVFDRQGGARRQRAAHAGASGIDGRLRHRDHGEASADARRGRLRHQRALRRRHPSSGP